MCHNRSNFLTKKTTTLNNGIYVWTQVPYYKLRRQENMTHQKVILHRSGEVTYWSVYCQVMIHRARGIGDSELAAMAASDRDRVIAHLRAHFSEEA